jgi:anti-sigma regulatory factor (Ser/Thr protein kinase)
VQLSPDGARLSLVPDLSAPVAARRALEGLETDLGEDVSERGALVISEVVTNSVKHAGMTAAQRIEVSISMLPECLRFEVTDEGDGFEPGPARHDPRSRAGGWGLVLVEELSDRWGVEVEHSTLVWCEFDLLNPNPLTTA